MKVVINAFSARLGGGQTYLKNLLKHLPIHEYLEILVFAPESLALPSHPQIKRVKTTWPTTNPLARAVWERFLLPRFLQKNHSDVLFCPGGIVGTRVPAGCKTVTMFRNMIPFDRELVKAIPLGFQRIRNIILRRVLLRSMASADLTIFISDHARSLIESLTYIPNPVTIPHGIGESFRSVTTTLPRPADAPRGRYILYVSRFDIYKHHREVIKAFSRLNLSHRNEFSVVFLGETNMPEAHYVKNLVNELDLEDRVHMLDAVPYAELPAWYQNAHIILFASSCENCPNILLESMGSGRPVLSSNVMPMPEFGGKDLIYFSPYEPDDISRAITQVLTDESTANKVAEAAKLRSSLYDWELTAKKTWSEIFALVNNED